MAFGFDFTTFTRTALPDSFLTDKQVINDPIRGNGDDFLDPDDILRDFSQVSRLGTGGGIFDRNPDPRDILNGTRGNINEIFAGPSFTTPTVLGNTFDSNQITSRNNPLLPNNTSGSLFSNFPTPNGILFDITSFGNSLINRQSVFNQPVAFQRLGNTSVGGFSALVPFNPDNPANLTAPIVGTPSLDNFPSGNAFTFPISPVFPLTSPINFGMLPTQPFGPVFNVPVNPPVDTPDTTPPATDPPTTDDGNPLPDLPVQPFVPFPVFSTGFVPTPFMLNFFVTPTDPPTDPPTDNPDTVPPVTNPPPGITVQPFVPFPTFSTGFVPVPFGFNLPVTDDPVIA